MGRSPVRAISLWCTDAYCANGCEQIMKCTIQDCPGAYEQRLIVHTVRYQGRIIVIDHVSAEVCQICGDVLLKPQTVRQIEALLRTLPHPKQTVPLYEFAAASSA